MVEKLLSDGRIRLKDCKSQKSGKNYNATLLLSTKHSGYGIGTESIRMIAERYHGDARFAWKDGIFYASIMLNP